MAKVAVTKLAWLAGILDGESCITAKRCSRNAVAFRITVEAVSEAMISAVMQLLVQFGVEYKTEPPTMRRNSTRPAYRVRVQKKQAVAKLCDLMLPYSVVKRAELELVKAYLDKAVGCYYTATEEDLKILEKLRELKKVA